MKVGHDAADFEGVIDYQQPTYFNAADENSTDGTREVSGGQGADKQVPTLPPLATLEEQSRERLHYRIITTVFRDHLKSNTNKPEKR